MPTNLTNEEEELSLSAQEAHSLSETLASNGWGIIKEKYFDVRLAEYKRYLYDVKNTDPVMIRSMVMMVDFIETMLSEIIQAIKTGLEDKEKIGEKEGKEKEENIKRGKSMKFEIGKYYRTYGGWKAIVIWKVYAGLKQQKEHYLVIHKPYDEDESCVILHNTEGEYLTTFSINEPPRYGKHHPADIKGESINNEINKTMKRLYAVNNELKEGNQ